MRNHIVQIPAVGPWGWSVEGVGASGHLGALVEGCGAGRQLRHAWV